MAVKFLISNKNSRVNFLKLLHGNFLPALFMNYRHEMFKYQEIQSTADKMDTGNNRLFSNPFS